MRNSLPGIFFTFAEQRKELRIKTMARLSSVENREIRRGSAYLLHWYGMPKRTADAEKLPPSWEKVKKTAEEARRWLDLIYLIECRRETSMQQIEDQILEVGRIKGNEHVMVVIDDGQCLRPGANPIQDRLTNIAEQLQGIAVERSIPILAVWPDLSEEPKTLPQAWADKLPSADVIRVIEKDLDRTKKLTEPNLAISLHVVKNRGGERGKLAYDFFPAFAKFSEA